MKFNEIAQLASDAPLDSGWGVAVVTIGLVIAVLIVHKVASFLAYRATRRYLPFRVLHRNVDKPVQLAVVMLALQFVWWNANDSLYLIQPLRRLSLLILIGTLTWLALRAVSAVVETVLTLHPLDTENNLSARSLHTQTKVLARCVMGGIIVIGTGAMLLTLPGVRQIGASLLASAGVAGLVAGIAARPVLANLIAGLQIAIAQPIRLDDVVVIQGEWGRVEEITGSYVTVRIWDERRLIVPLQWCIENPFQNWTRSSSQLIGSVFIWVDYRMPLEPLRNELKRLCEVASEWDGRVQVLQVTDANERAMQLRALVSSVDSPLNWDLRCKIREGLLAFVHEYSPEYLPRLRNEISHGTRHADAGPRPDAALSDRNEARDMSAI